MYKSHNFFVFIDEFFNVFLLRYTSKFREPVKDEYFTYKGDHKTMGQAKVPVPTTDNFLKKHSKEPRLPDSKYYIVCRCVTAKN